MVSKGDGLPPFFLWSFTRVCAILFMQTSFLPLVSIHISRKMTTPDTLEDVQE
jgi:hypothetical protein